MTEEVAKEKEQKESDQENQSRAFAVKISPFHQPTQRHGNKNRGVGITRKNKEESKKRRKMAKESRKKNRR